jgi:hypothetical protein
VGRSGGAPSRDRLLVLTGRRPPGRSSGISRFLTTREHHRRGSASAGGERANVQKPPANPRPADGRGYGRLSELDPERELPAFVP